jgi:hypothetical protein
LVYERHSLAAKRGTSVLVSVFIELVNVSLITSFFDTVPIVEIIAFTMGIIVHAVANVLATIVIGVTCVHELLFFYSGHRMGPRILCGSLERLVALWLVIISCTKLMAGARD